MKKTQEKIESALVQMGWGEPEIKTLCKEDTLLHLRAMLELTPHLLEPPKIVDLSGSVDVGGLSINWNLRQRSKVWSSDNFDLIQTTEQLHGQHEDSLNYGFDIRDKYSPINACLLQHLLLYPFLIPKEWRQYVDGRPRCICFLGTTYLTSQRQIFARGMHFDLNRNIWYEGFWPLSKISHPDFCVVVPK